MNNKVVKWLMGLSFMGKIATIAVGSIIGGAAITAVASQQSDTKADVKAAQTQSRSAASEEYVTNIDLAETIPFQSSSVNDSSLEQGKSYVKTTGANGTRVKTYKVTSSNGNELSRELIKDIVTVAPVSQITVIGTGVNNCDSNYSGACVPIASDVDCAGGSGNGPAYTSGPVYVVGYDKYDLDRNGDGVGCE